MRKTEVMKKGLSLLLCLSLILCCVPTAFAADDTGLCQHHEEHTAECGYAEAVSGSDCTHDHAESCYKLRQCILEHEDPTLCTVESGCIQVKLDCSHSHDGECGYQPAKQGTPCRHAAGEHNESCGYKAEVLCNCPAVLTHGEGCGYDAAVEGQSCACVPAVQHDPETCTYEAEVPCAHTEHTDCGKTEDTDEIPCNHVHSVIVDSAASCYALLCAHAEADGHDDLCGFVAAEEESPCAYDCPECEAVENVRDLIQALPGLEELKAMDVTGQEQVYNQLLAADEAYQALTDAQKAQLAEENAALDALFDYFSSFRMELPENTYSVGDYAGLKAAVDAINTLGSGEYIISLMGNITINDTSITALTLNKPVTVTLLGNGYSITGTGKTNMFSVQGGATLVLGAADETDTLVLDANEQGYGIDVTNGTLKMHNGVTIQKAKSSGKGGVSVSDDSSEFYMYGGTITNCHVTSTGNGGGGIAARGGSTLTITDGTVSNCSAGKSGGGIYVDGNASANISNAVITNNYVGKIKDAPSNNFDGMSYWGGGIFIGNLNGPVTIQKCTITNNKAYGWYGGGIAIANDSQNITIDSCQIAGNSCWRYGGGVALLGYKVNESDGITISNSTITGNTTLGGGGGIANASNKLTLQNTAVYANHADGAGDDFVGLLKWVSGLEYVSSTLCEVPEGLTLTEDGKETAITGWYEDGNNILGEEETGLRWGDSYNEGYYCEEVPVPAEPITTDIALKAAYNMGKKTISYDLDGGIGAEGVDYTAEQVETGTEVTVKAAPTKAGYTFTGWSDGTNTYQPGDKITVASDMTLTAQWSEILKCTVTYNLNGGTGAEGVDYTAAQVETGTEVTVKAAPTKAGYTFTGWSDGTNPHQPGSEITVTGNITLTAQWEESVTYTVTYTDGVSGEEIFPDEVYDGLLNGVNTPSFKGTLKRKGYIFYGWNPQIAKTVTKDVTYKATWERDRNGNGIADKDEWFGELDDVPKTGDQIITTMGGCAAVIALLAAAAVILSRKRSVR